MRAKTASLLALAIVVASSIGLPAIARADVNDFVVTSFQADETLSRTDKQGELHIVERLKVDFHSYNHGILRAIPKTYKHHSLQIDVKSVSSDTHAPSGYSTSSNNGNMVLKIGDANQTVTGPQEYTIDYTVRNVISFYNDHDELYWDVNGDQWLQTFESATATLHTPSNLQLKQPALCYTGAYGVSASNCTVSTSGQQTAISTNKPLTAKQTLTYVASFDKGYFTPSTWYESVGEYAKQILSFVLPILLIGGGSIIYWYRKGRDPKGSGVIVAQYDAPSGLKPLAVGALMDFKADKQDITATIIDLAIRKYIRIIEQTDKKIFKDKTIYNLELLNIDYGPLDPNETKLMYALFSDQTVGAKVDVSSLASKLYSTAEKLSKNTTKQMTDDGYFNGSTSKASGVMSIVIIVIFVLVWLFGIFMSVWTVASLVVSILIAVICMNALSARTPKGVAAKEHAEGLKLYLNVAEKDRIAKLQSPNAAYAPNAGEPVRTVELFEKLLPYAMVLGVEQQWAGQFANLYTSPPDWYTGNFNTFNTLYLVNSLNTGVGTAVSTAFSAPSSSGSSGGGGGGFSGGGGGGGGGGGW